MFYVRTCAKEMSKTPCDGRDHAAGAGPRATNLCLSQGGAAGLARSGGGGEARAGASITWDARDLDAHCAAHLDGAE